MSEPVAEPVAESTEEKLNRLINMLKNTYKQVECHENNVYWNCNMLSIREELDSL